jgi:protein-S-isoprenylcysteine O-methyltransferase Ste14
MAVKVILTLAIEAVVFSALLFGGAGTIHWPAGWAYMGLFLVVGVWMTAWLGRRDPALLAERMKWPVQKGQPVWDKIWIWPMILAWCGWMVLMGMDAVRFRWSGMPAWLQGLGGVMMLLSCWMMVRVFRENTFLAAVVRIQTERGHKVISTGPYAIVRHPLYATMLVYMPANALVLGSW